MVAFVTETIAMQDNAKWEGRAKALVKSELKRKALTYNQLVERLAAIGVAETEPNIRNKLARGKFTAAFFLQVMEAIGSSQIRLDYGEEL